jgi:hypothetical protein
MSHCKRKYCFQELQYSFDTKLLNFVKLSKYPLKRITVIQVNVKFLRSAIHFYVVDVELKTTFCLYFV